MNINWVLADQIILDPTVDLDQMKELGSIWGSWRTWRACLTDNVVCHNTKKAHELIQRNFHANCNFYIQNSTYQTLGKPDNVNIFEGQFIEDVEQADEIISMHLASTVSDIILLLGFDWQEQTKHTDKLIEHKARVYRTLVDHAIKDNPQVQWVLVDHDAELRPELAKLENLTKDSMENILKLIPS